MERSQDGSTDTDIAQPAEGYSPSLLAYEALPLAIMSALLEHNREVKPDILYREMRDDGVVRNRVTACIRKTLLRNEMLWLKDGVIIASENGTDYVAANTHHIEGAEREAVKTKKELAEATKSNTAKADGHGPSNSEVLLTAQAMSEEINLMRQALNESPKDFGYIESCDETAMSKLIDDLAADMKKLGRRLDSR